MILSDPEVVISRIFDAPRELVFRAWTTAEALQSWSAPRGCQLQIHSFDFQPGGHFHHCIRTPSGYQCWCRGIFREIVAPERIVYSMAVSNAAGELIEPVDAGMDPDWPKETIVTVHFSERGSQTEITLHQTVSKVIATRTGAYPSWLQMFDLLAEYCAK